MRHYLQPISLMVIFLWASFSFAQQVKPPVRPNNPQTMISKDDKDPRWKQVDSLSGQGLPQSALKLVANIMQEAQKSGDHPQFLKANLYELKLRSEYEENYLVNYITEREKLLSDGKLSEPVTQILHSILGDLYWQYYSMNRYVILDRTVMDNVPSDIDNRKSSGPAGDNLPPIDTWDVNMFVRTSSIHFTKSLENPQLLQSITLKQFDPIIERGDNSKILRPTLFDFLAFRAVDFFMNEEASLTKPVYLFVMKDPNLLSDARTFSLLKFDTKDSLSFQLQALKIFQQIIKFHITDIDDHEPLVDADLKRLEFVYKNINNPDKDSLYLNTLLTLERKFANKPVAAMVMEKIAHYYKDAPEDPFRVLKSTITPEILPKQVDYVKAKEWCLKAINTFPETNAAKNCRIMLKQIEQPSIEFKTNEVVVPDEAFPILLTYKNLKKIWFRLIRDFDLSEREMYSEREETLKKLLNAVTVKAWAENIPDKGDYKTVKTELILPELPAGQYILIASTSEKFDKNDSTIAYSTLQVSNLSYISRNAPDGSGLVYVLNRKDGKPIKGVDVQSFTMNYDYKSRKYTRQNRDRYTTKEDGSFTIKSPAANQNANLSFEFRYKKDTLVAANYYALYDRGRYRGERDHIQTFFFTDRAIYRPGQPIYFKGIVVKNNQKQSVILPDHRSTVTLYDVNGQKLSSLDVVSGDFGSFSGSFVLPSTGLTGQMRIESGSGSVFFAVEEYKRPKFEVTFKEIDSTYRLNQEVVVTGEALSYTGTALSDATVNYRVVRSIVFPFYRGGYLFEDLRIWPPYRSAVAEITNGSVLVGADGSFKITFTAVPDPENYGMENQHYTFEVYADVTDINGETQSGRTAVNVSNKALILASDIPLEVNAKEVKPVTVKSTNLNGKKVPASVKVELHKLKDGELLVPRTWDIPDTLMYTKEEFKSRLPHYPFMDEIEKQQNWLDYPAEVKPEKEKLVWSTSVNTIKDSILNLKDLQLEPGRYLLTLSSKDKYGTPVTEEKQIIVYNPDSKKLPAPEHLWFSILTQKPQKGENISLLAGSAVNGKLLIEIQSDGKILKHQWYNITGQQKLEFKLPDSLTGQVSILANLVYDNHNFFEQQEVNIEDNSKKLNFAFESLRSPLLPGGTEKWKIKITDAEGKPLQAELLASMYDASLDAFVKHQWFFSLYQTWEQRYNWELNQAFIIRGSLSLPQEYYGDAFFTQEYDQLNWFGYNTFNYFNGGGIRHAKSGRAGEVMLEAQSDAMEMEVAGKVSNSQEPPAVPSPAAETKELQIRRNLQETAFFYPQLTTNKNGEVWVEFTVPEALTRWNFMGLAHNTELANGQFTKEILTQKQLMVTPNLPRYFRDGDELVLRSKINNLTPNPMQGEATLELIDAMTMQPVDAAFANTAIKATFEIKENGNTMVEWKVKVPADVQMVMVRITAKAGNYSDGEEVMLPVLTNRMLVTETLPLPVNGNQTKKFEFKKLVELSASTTQNKPSNNPSGTLTPHRLTLEFTSNPAWYALQALPWLEAQERENSDQIFNRYYANSIAAFVANSSPKIRSVFESWKNQTPEALLSNLEKNQELKAMVIDETPWLAEAKNESDQKRRIALMFDLNRIATEKSSALRRLQQNQSANGGWPWFEGMPESRYITQWIITGMGKLNHIGVINLKTDPESKQMVQNAMNYLSERIREDYERLLKDSTNYSNRQLGSNNNKKDPDDKYLENDHLGYEQIQFLYAISYLTGIAEPSDAAKTAISYYSGQARKYWNNKGLYPQAMIALWSGRSGDVKTTTSIMSSMREKAITNEEMGTYWRDNTGGFYWYQAPIETQAILIELFEEMGVQTTGKAMGKADGTNDVSFEVDRMKTWLLKQKQTQSWPTTTATAEAVYALLLRGTDWLQTKPSVIIRTGSEMIDLTAGKIPGVQTEAGTGYFKTSWSGKEITPEMGNVTVAKSDAGPAWGAMYFQYFENLDKIKAANTPLSILKEIFVKEFTPEGERLKKVTTENQLNVGDQLTVRVEIRSDRDLEFVQLKDMRAASFEPVTTISGYQWKGGLGYYQSTRDASTNFFIYYLPKGTYVFEYRLVVAQEGDFSNGITTIQCMYAPEFAAHSEGMRVKVQK